MKLTSFRHFQEPFLTTQQGEAATKNGPFFRKVLVFDLSQAVRVARFESVSVGNSQTCLGANVLSGLVPSTVFKKNLWAFLGLVYGKGGAPGTVPLHNLRVTSHLLHQEAPLGWYRVRLS